MDWYVVHTRLGHELTAATLLEQELKLEVYLPEVLQRVRKKLAPRPLFPGYLFVRPGAEEGALDQIDQNPAYGHLVRFGRQADSPGTPARLPPDVVANLRARAAAIDAEGGLPAHTFKAGQHVEVVSGPLQGLDAIFVGPMTPSARVEILLRFLGQEQHLTVDVEMVRPRSGDKRPRRTRGGHRKVQPPKDEGDGG